MSKGGDANSTNPAGPVPAGDFAIPELPAQEAEEIEAIEESFPQLVSRIVEDAKEVARAEIDLARVKAAGIVARYRVAVALFAAAAALAIAALVAGAVGAILALATLIGAAWATLAVVLALLLVAVLLAKAGANRFKRKFTTAPPPELE